MSEEEVRFEFATSRDVQDGYRKGDFSVAAISSLELFDALLSVEQTPLCRFVKLVEPQPGAPETWPEGRCYTPLALWGPFGVEASTEEVEFFAENLWQKAIASHWGGPCEYTPLAELVKGA